ncbi:UDP-2,3-diacylglucosamine diphosphatase [Nitrosomonas sp. Nm34]|uniref:UDP-2,3-diacylglucosamine diphosphatase n=1 Tax=Nitrosomonas sp. Nm34 TaxID=1881055 RepID=UPI0008E68465|nr:UDP-2,3-diacylglucosamine diphosphatase [Nitrosomonas sp. Nm34]SFI22398.1 UDP-2,3-diacylglucosamine pyrophosphatase LpxH [Nitrosomonas sp. Nm34]
MNKLNGYFYANALKASFLNNEDSSTIIPKPRVRTVFISDIHLGTPGCQAQALLEFLRAYPSEQLYLVGDIIDGWQLRQGWYWPQSHNDVIQKLLRRVRKGCKVVYVPGNHDEFARQFLGHSFGGIEVVEEVIYQTVDGRKFWIIHGDYFDGVVQCAKWLAYVGDNLYELTLKLNRYLSSLRARLGMPYWSLSRYLKHKVKTAVSYVTSFEQAVAMEARRRGLDGVICGHIHHPEIRDINGITYCNDGDWVESLSALVEHFDGRIELVHWPQCQRELENQSSASAEDTLAIPDHMPATAKVKEKDEALA